VNVFCPEGYVPTQKAIVIAAQYWFAEELVAITAGATDRPAPENEPESEVQGLARAPSPLSISDFVRLFDICVRSANKLRHSLHQGLVNAYYFGNGLLAGRQKVASEFWATSDADRVLESGKFFSFSVPRASREYPLNYPLFLLQAELDALLSEPKAAKKRLPGSKKLALAAALGRLYELPTRKAQLGALRELAEFREYDITEKLFREAAQKAPRRPGVKAKRD
jgi:hypothetical protein